MTGAGLLLPFWWDTQKLRALPLPAEPMPVGVLDWHLTWRCWAYNGQPFELAPEDVLHEPTRYPHHAQRIALADLSYPIDITWWNGRWTIMDGIHRLTRAVQQDQAQIQVRKVRPDDLARITRDPPARSTELTTLSNQLMPGDCPVLCGAPRGAGYPEGGGRPFLLRPS